MMNKKPKKVRWSFCLFEFVDWISQLFGRLGWHVKKGRRITNILNVRKFRMDRLPEKFLTRKIKKSIRKETLAHFLGKYFIQCRHHDQGKNRRGD
jgi:hypothetical protein